MLSIIKLGLCFILFMGFFAWSEESVSSRPLKALSGIEGKLEEKQGAASLTFEEDSSACSDCAFSVLLKQPELFFKSLEQYYGETPSLHMQDQQLSVKLFEEFASDREAGDYTLTVGVRRQSMDLSDPKYSAHTSAEEDIKAKWLDFSKNSKPLSYRVKVLRLDDSWQNWTEEEAYTWSGVISYHLAQVLSHDVFLKGGMGSNQKAFGLFSWRNDSTPLSQLEWESDTPDLTKDYVTYEVGVRIAKEESSFLDVSAFESSAKNKKNTLYFQSLSPTQNIQGMEVRTGFFLRPWEGEVRYSYVNDDNAGVRDTQFMREFGTLRLNYSPTSKVIFGTVWKHQGENIFNSTKSKDTLDVYSFYNLSPASRLGILLQNVTDEPPDHYNRVPLGDVLRDRERTLWLQFEFHN